MVVVVVVVVVVYDLIRLLQGKLLEKCNIKHNCSMSLVFVRELICSICVPHHVPGKNTYRMVPFVFKTLLLATREHLHLCHQFESPNRLVRSPN